MLRLHPSTRSCAVISGPPPLAGDTAFAPLAICSRAARSRLVPTVLLPLCSLACWLCLALVVGKAPPPLALLVPTAASDASLAWIAAASVFEKNTRHPGDLEGSWGLEVSLEGQAI